MYLLHKLHIIKTYSRQSLLYYNFTAIFFYKVNTEMLMILWTYHLIESELWKHWNVLEADLHVNLDSSGNRNTRAVLKCVLQKVGGRFTFPIWTSEQLNVLVFLYILRGETASNRMFCFVTREYKLVRWRVPQETTALT